MGTAQAMWDYQQGRFQQPIHAQTYIASHALSAAYQDEHTVQLFHFLRTQWRLKATMEKILCSTFQDVCVPMSSTVFMIITISSCSWYAYVQSFKSLREKLLHRDPLSTRECSQGIHDRRDASSWAWFSDCWTFYCIGTSYFWVPCCYSTQAIFLTWPSFCWFLWWSTY